MLGKSQEGLEIGSAGTGAVQAGQCRKCLHFGHSQELGFASNLPAASAWAIGTRKKSSGSRPYGETDSSVPVLRSKMLP